MKFAVTIPAFEIPESLTFAHSTRLADSWAPRPEAIIQPACIVPEIEVTIEVGLGVASALHSSSPTRNPIRMLRRRRGLDLPGKYLFDTRFECGTNLGHMIVEVAGKILLARREISERLGEPVEIHAILKRDPAPMSVQLFELLGIPTVETDHQIRGTIVRTSHGGRIMAALPDLWEDVPGFPDGAPTPEKIYISRRGSRSLVNEAEIVDLLESHGFRRYLFETDVLPVREQMRVMAGAEQVVAIHGAAMSSIVFNRHGLARDRGDLGGLSVIELHGAGYFTDWNRRFAAAMNARWCGVRGQITPEVIRTVELGGKARSNQSSPFRVDPESLRMALEYSSRRAAPRPRTATIGAMQ